MSSLVESFSGIRGVWGESLTEDACRRYGFSYGQWVTRHHANATVVVGADTRPSRPYVKRAIEAGMVAAGVAEIIDIGILSTPATEHAVRAFGAAGGVMITASHNPAEHNGMKFLQPSGAVLNAEDAAAVIAASRQPAPVVHSRHVGMSDRRGEAIAAYLAHLEVSTHLTREDVEQFHDRVLFDFNGGAGSEPGIAFAKEWSIPADFYHELPGDFWRAIEPNATSLTPLAHKLASEGLAFACAFDCDADRMELVLPASSRFARAQGTPVVSGQYVLGLVVRAVLETTPDIRSLPIVTNDATSQLVADVARGFGATVEEVEVGETNVVTRMLERGSVLGGEGSSGGSIVAPGQCRDGLQALAIIVKYLARKGVSLDDALTSLPQFSTLAVKVQCPGEKQRAVRGALVTAYQNTGARVVTSGGDDGGVKAWTSDDTWVWFRASKTEPGVFRCIADARERSTAEDLLAEAKVVFDTVAANA